MKVSISKNIKLDVMRLVETRLLLQGSSGSGKSMTLRKILEKTFGIIPHIIIDIEGEFATLREKFDYILAGKGGDISVDVRTAQLLARKMLELNASIIIDISELKPLDRHRYVRLFIEALIEAPKELWGPRLIVIDEAHTFCPEKSAGSSEAWESVIDLCSRGRKRGLGAILATQRLSKLNKDAAAECSNKIMGLANIDIDRERSAKELGFTHREDILALRDLEPGEFFCVGPALCKTVTKTKIDLAETSHPKIGKRVVKKPVATHRVLKLLEKIKDLPKEAEQELKTVGDFKAKIQELTAKLREVPKPQVITEKVNVEKIRREIAVAYRVSTKKWVDDFVKEIREFSGKMGTRPEWVPPELKQEVIEVHSVPSNHAFSIRKVSVDQPVSGIMKSGYEEYGKTADFKLSKNHRLILNNLCQFPEKVFKVSQIALMCGVSNNGHFSNELTALAQQGLITRDSGKVQIREVSTATALLGSYFKPRDKSIVEFWREKLNPQRRLIFEVLLNQPGKGFRLEEVAQAVSKANNGHFSNECTALTTLGLITRNHGTIQLHPDVLMES